MASSRIAHGVMSLLEKMRSQDSDLRFMALNDLMAELRKDTFMQLDDGIESQTVNQVLELMKDSNGEVKNMAVKCLGILVKRIRERQMQAIIDRLVEYISSKEEELRDIASLGLKTVIGEIPSESNLAHTASAKLAPKLIAQIGDPSSSQELLIDSLDVLADVFTRFSSSLAQNVQIQKQALNALVQTMGHQRPAVRKRSLVALGALGSCSTSEIFTQLAVQMHNDLQLVQLERTRTVVQLIGTLARTSPRRLGRRLPEFMPLVIATVKQDDDELREVCMQTMESILLKCPTEVTPFVNAIIESGLKLIKHDPNYAPGGDDSDEEMGDVEDEDDDEDLFDEDYSDDDDLSWKVRRASAKVLNAAITSRPELLAHNASIIAPVLVSRFSEREESVRLEVLETFLSLLKQIQVYGGVPQATEVIGSSHGPLKRKRQDMETDEVEGSPRNLLNSLVPAIAKALGKEIISKSLPTRHKSFSVLRELVNVLHGGLDAHVGLLVVQTEKALKGAESASGPSSNLKAEILGFLRLLFLTHPPRSFEDHLPKLVPVLASSIEDKLHRNCIEAFQACSQLVAVLRPINGSSTDSKARAASFKPHLVRIYDATIARLSRSDSDQEIKEKGIACLGGLISHAGDDLADKYDQCLPLLVDRLRNEVTRYATVRVVADIVSSPMCKGPAFDSFIRECIGEVATLLRKNNRLLKLAAFDCLAALLAASGSKLEQSSSNLILSEVQPLLSQDVDMNLLPLVLQNVGLILKAQPSSLSDVQDSILPDVYGLLRSPLAQGPALDALLAFFKALVSADPSIADDTITRLLSSLEKPGSDSAAGTHTYSTISRCIGAVVIESRRSAPKVVERASKALQKPAKGKESEVYFSLLLLGELGRFENFSSDKSLFERVLSYYRAESEEVKIAAAFAVGNMAVGSLDSFLPVIEEHVRSDDEKRFLSLHALKELITHGSHEQLAVVAERVWVPLFDSCETKEEGTRNIGAECLARLTLTDPAKYLVQLQERLRSPSASTRAAVIAAVRFTLTESSSSYDELLSPIIVDFLSLLRDPDLDVRRHAMFALNSAAHNKPHLIREHLVTLLPLLYQETFLKEELLRKVSMGPFTVTTDDGLDLRKNAYETMYQLLDTCLSRITLTEYMSRVIAGLSDDDGIKVLCYLMLVRLAELAPVQVAQSLDDISEPISATLKAKLKDNSTKQEIEKAAELQRFVFRALVALNKLSSANAAPRFSQLIREAKTSGHSNLYREMEAAQAHNSGGGAFGLSNGSGMDLEA
ncbi:TIP120-domain-containing protein [Violaceomyces palustris]|uniref:TIP120-domain-containing protein n=1 Tax=Violaceomyces palustris TaxID=1673888 RepID=A0ACD0P0N4_9BASI|nr:TIP120-domain-containing protein [Violaceomyces palustris]